MLYLVKGKVDFLRNTQIEQIIQNIKSQNEQIAVSYMSITGYQKNSLVEKISPSLFGDAPVLVIDGFELGGDNLQEDIISLFENDSLLENSLVILGHKGGVKGRKIINLVQKKLSTHLTSLIETPEIKYDNQKVNFVIEEFRKLGCSIRLDIATKLVNAVGEDIAELHAYIKQISEDIDENNKVIDNKVISAYFAGHSQVEIFSLVDAIMGMNKSYALILLRLFVDGGGSIQALVGILSKKLETLLEIILIDRKKTDAKLNPYVIKTTRPLLAQFNEDRIIKALQELSKVDYASKGGDLDGGYSSIERFITII